MGGPVTLVARSQARRRWWALIALTIFVGLVGGLSISLIAGSRRSSSVVDHYFAAARKYDLGLSAPFLTERRVRALPGVLRADPATYVAMIATGPKGKITGGINGLAVDWTAVDPTNRILEGTVPDGSDPSEVVVNESFVEQYGLSVGDTVHVQMFGSEQNDDVSRGVYRPTGPRYEFRIAAVARGTQDVAIDEVHSPGQSARSSADAMLLSNDFYEAHRDEFLNFGAAYFVQLRDAARDRERFEAAAIALAPSGEDAPEIFPDENASRRGSFETPVQLETTALLALGIGLALAGTIAATLVLRAEQRTHDGDTPALRALGCTAPQLGGVATLRALPAAVVGACIAVGVALALSARYPIGIGQQLALERGFQANVAVVVIGALAIVVLVLGAAFLFGWPRRTRDIAPSKVGAFAPWLGRVGAPTDLTVAAHLAFDRARAARSVPSRQAIVGGAALLAILTAVGVYVGGVDHLYTVPAAHGWAWDAAIGNSNFPLSDDTAAKVAADRRIGAATAARYGQATLDGKSVEFLAFDAKGDAPPEIVAGRLPTAPGEVALGGGLMDELHLHVGSTATFSVADGEFDTGGRTHPRTMKVVGEALSPVFGESDIGKVGVVTLDGVAAAGGDDTPQYELVRFKGGATHANVTALDRDYTEEIATDAVAARIVNLHRVRGLPLIGIAVAGLMGLFVLIYALAVSVRARMRDLAVLRAIGLPARRIRRVLAWQGGVLGVGIVIIGVPAGLLLGSALWRRVADGLGVQHAAVVAPILLLLVPLTVLVAIGASLYPGRRASRESITTLLRAE